MKNLYRYEIQYSNTDGDETNVTLQEYQIKRETKSMYFIKYPLYQYITNLTKRVKKDAYNTFAYDTKEKAMKHFIRRTSRRIDWFEYWKEECEKALKIAKQLKVEEI